MYKRFYRYGVVHAGACHRDDVYAMAIASEYLGVNWFERRDPTAAELLDPGVLVLDVGGQYNGEVSNYDHHQFPREHEPVCALTLLCRSLGIDAAMRELFPWYAGTELLDSKGPFAMAKEAGTTWDKMVPLLGPVEEMLFAAISACPVVVDCQWLKDTGRSIRKQIEAAAEWFEVADSGLVKLGTVTGKQDQVIHGLAASTLVPTPEATKMLGIYRQRIQKREGITIDWSLTLDDRGPGYTLYRFGDSPRLDFSKVAGLPGVTFAHTGGFLVKTGVMSVETAVKLVSIASFV